MENVNYSDSVELNLADERIVIGSKVVVGARKFRPPSLVQAEEEMIEPQDSVKRGAPIRDRRSGEGGRGSAVGGVLKAEPRVQIGAEHERVGALQCRDQPTRLTGPAELATGDPQAPRPHHVVEMRRDDANLPRRPGVADAGNGRRDGDAALAFERKLYRGEISQGQRREDCVPPVFS